MDILFGILLAIFATGMGVGIALMVFGLWTMRQSKKTQTPQTVNPELTKTDTYGAEYKGV